MIVNPPASIPEYVVVSPFGHAGIGSVVGPWLDASLCDASVLLSEPPAHAIAGVQSPEPESGSPEPAPAPLPSPEPEPDPFDAPEPEAPPATAQRPAGAQSKGIRRTLEILRECPSLATALAPNSHTRRAWRDQGRVGKLPSPLTLKYHEQVCATLPHTAEPITRRSAKPKPGAARRASPARGRARP